MDYKDHDGDYKDHDIDYKDDDDKTSMLQDQATSSLAASSLPSSSERSSSSAFQLEVKEGMESDEEIRRVPEIGGESAGASVSGREAGSLAGPDRVQVAAESQRKRGRSPADKESKRLKRLLRNRVSAQQARERKKAYLSDLEVRVKDLEQKNSELEERLSTLQNENQMLRHILKNTTASRRGGGGANAEGSGSAPPTDVSLGDELHLDGEDVAMAHADALDDFDLDMLGDGDSPGPGFTPHDSAPYGALDMADFEFEQMFTDALGIDEYGG